MNDSDNKAFQDFVIGKEFPDGIPDDVVFEPHEVLRQTWEAACEYKQVEIDNLRSMLQSTILVYEEQLDRFRGNTKDSILGVGNDQT